MEKPSWASFFNVKALSDNHKHENTNDQDQEQSLSESDEKKDKALHFSRKQIAAMDKYSKLISKDLESKVTTEHLFPFKWGSFLPLFVVIVSGGRDWIIFRLHCLQFQKSQFGNPSCPPLKAQTRKSV